MKKLILIILLALIYSCQPRIKNDIKTLDKVFNMSDFDIEIQNWGCFGGGKEYFTVNKKNNDYILKSKKTEKSHLVSKVKMDSLKNYLMSNIGKDSFDGCTTTEYIRIGSFFNSIDYEHTYCNGIIDDLLNYNELISKKEPKE